MKFMSDGVEDSLLSIMKNNAFNRYRVSILITSGVDNVDSRECR